VRDVPSGLAGQAVPEFVEQPHGLSPQHRLVHELIGELGVEQRELAERVHDVRAQDERITVGLRQA
jgi:hypothetical protein